MDKKQGRYNMGNLSNDARKTLPEFQEFLVKKSLAPEKNVPFLAYWVSRFLEYSRRHDIAATEYQETAVSEFLDTLRDDKKILDWQPRQADDAIKLYYFHYLGKTSSHMSGAISAADMPSVVAEIKRLIRLRHYSYSTERTYLQWVERFLYACDQEKTDPDLTSQDFKDFQPSCLEAEGFPQHEPV
jgi:hypothetical protein